jgi:hypothetical protein
MSPVDRNRAHVFMPVNESGSIDDARLALNA